MESIGLAVEHDKSALLRNVRLKISEWLDFENGESNVIFTVYFEFSEYGKPQEFDHMYLVVPKNDIQYIIFPTEDEIKRENEILKEKELSKLINIKGQFIPSIDVDRISLYKQGEEHVLIRVDLKEFEINHDRKNRFQFLLHVRNSFRKNPWLSTFLGSSWEWTYEARIHPLVMSVNEFAEVARIEMGLELWVMIEPKMYTSISDLNIRNSQPFDRLIVLPSTSAEKFARSFINPKALCIRWNFPEFSESGISTEIIINKRRSELERERKYTDMINSDTTSFFSVVDNILNESRIVCIDFEYISLRIKKTEFSRFLDILFQILYHRDDVAFSRLGELVDILEQHQNLKYGRYYFQMFRLLHKMQISQRISEIISPNLRNWLDDFIRESEFINKMVSDLFVEIRCLIDFIEQFSLYTIPKEKYSQKMKILMEIEELRDIAKYKLINPQSYLLNEQILLKWELLVEDEFKRFAGTPKLNIELKTRNLLNSEIVHLIFDITNISDVPVVNLVTELLPSKQYDFLENRKIETHVRKQLTKSSDKDKRIFSPEFVIVPKKSRNILINLKIRFNTEEGRIFTEIFEEEIELFQEDTLFEEISSNPYIAGPPLETENMFYGRNDIFKQICSYNREELKNQAVIYGQYRIGKTSMLYQLKRSLGEKNIPVLAIVHAYTDSELLHQWSERVVAAVRSDINIVQNIPDYEISKHPYKEFQDFLNNLLIEMEEKRIIFMIDEYEFVDNLVQERKISEKVFHLLDWMIKHDRIELILAGRLQVTDLRDEEWRRITRSFAQIPMGFLEEEDALRLITEPVETYLKYDDSATEKILRLTNRHPYLIQLCCYVLVNYHNSKRKPTLTYSDVEEKIPEIIELGSLGLKAVILTDATEEEKLVLRVMANSLEKQTSVSEEELVVGISKYNPQISDRDIKIALSNLEKREVVRSVTEKMRRFKFVCDLFRYWVISNIEPFQ